MLLRDHVSALRRERDQIEAMMLNQHIHQTAAEHLQGDALEDLGKDTQRKRSYSQLWITLN